MDKWYDKYINAVFTSGVMSGTSDKYFSPEKELTLYQADMLVKKLCTSGSFELRYNLEDKDKPISYKIWNEACVRLAGNSVNVSDILVYGGKGECSLLGDRFIMCNGGLRSIEGLDFSQYRDKIVRVAIRDREIIAPIQVVNTTPIIKNVEITSCNQNRAEVKLNGCRRVFTLDNSENIFKAGDRVNIAFEEDGGYTISLCG